MYLKDTKESLWRQFFELHPNGMKLEFSENKCELVARLRKNIGEETQREIKGIYLP